MTVIHKKKKKARVEAKTKTGGRADYSHINAGMVYVSCRKEARSTF